MAVIQTILWAQWKSIRILRFGAGRKGALFSGLTSMFWYGFWTLAALGVSAFTSDPHSRRDIETLLPAILIFVVIYWQLAPVLVKSRQTNVELKFQAPRQTTVSRTLDLRAGGALRVLMTTSVHQRP